MKNQVKVTKTEVYKDSQGEHLVCKGKLVLLPTDVGGIVINHNEYIPIIISETEKIEVGDNSYFMLHSAVDPEIEIGMSIIKVNVQFQADALNKSENAYKILSLQEYFSPKHLQAIVDGKLKDYDDVYVQCINIVHPEWDKPVGTEWHESIIKIIDNHIKLFHVKQETFTKDELYWACIKCVELYEVENQVIDSKRIKTPSEVVESWLSKNYK